MFKYLTFLCYLSSPFIYEYLLSMVFSDKKLFILNARNDILNTDLSVIQSVISLPCSQDMQDSLISLPSIISQTIQDELIDA